MKLIWTEKIYLEFFNCCLIPIPLSGKKLHLVVWMGTCSTPQSKGAGSIPVAANHLGFIGGTWI